MLPHGFKDWRTTLPGLVVGFFLFVHFAPQHFPAWMNDLAAWMISVGFGLFGINAASSAKVIEKTDEKFERAGIPVPADDIEDDGPHAA